MGMLLLLLHTLLISLIAGARLTDAWGKEGHFMVCKIAEQYLTEKSSKAVLELLPESAGGELAAVCSWADENRFRYRWSSPLHYVNTPGVCGYKYSRDCHNSKGEKGMCVVGAINNYTDQLQSFGKSSNGYNLTESLMFLAHFVGDVHQPLHVGFEADEGGNTIIIHWYRRKTNLHHDGWSDEVDNWEKCRNKRVTCANNYALESIHLACNYAYKDVEQNSTLGDEYFFSRLPIVEKRIAQAGVRLALILNRIFDASSGEGIQSYYKRERLWSLLVNN